SIGVFVKAIEWDEDGFNTPNQRFKDITTLDEKTGQITITNLTVEHSGLYTIDVNSKEQEQRFNLEVLSEMILIIILININTVKTFGTIVWKNSAGQTLKGSEHHPTENGASPETSDPTIIVQSFKTFELCFLIFCALLLKTQNKHL
uniref:Immunoglobulin subtype domain-containing protein n=1 Tax=Sinocyclocheilus rhinocerous TaxID=307959 RepID=A0A673LMW4_9TELE